MAKSYLESTEEGKAAQFIKFKNHIGDYAELLGFPKVNNLLNPDLQQQAKDADYYDWVVKQVGAGRDYAKAITAWRDAALLSRGRGVGQPPRNALRVVECGGKRSATPLWLGPALGHERNIKSRLRRKSQRRRRCALPAHSKVLQSRGRGVAVDFQSAVEGGHPAARLGRSTKIWCAEILTPLPPGWKPRLHGRHECPPLQVSPCRQRAAIFLFPRSTGGALPRRRHEASRPRPGQALRPFVSNSHFSLVFIISAQVTSVFL